ncbi:MAG: hypothetical protein R3E39_15670 [Anaerolineae bacterium]
MFNNDQPNVFQKFSARTLLPGLSSGTAAGSVKTRPELGKRRWFSRVGNRLYWIIGRTTGGAEGEKWKESLTGNLLNQQWRFLLEWVILNIIGYMIGSLLGATDNGVLPNLLGHTLPAKVAGDVAYGAAFGLAQAVVFWRYFPHSRGRLWLWVAASVIGFTLGARFGARFAPIIISVSPWVGILFGVIVGGCLGGVQWGAMRWLGVLKTDNAFWWIPASIVAWVVGETIAFGSNFSQMTVPLVALGIALVTGVSLINWIRPS